MILGSAIKSFVIEGHMRAVAVLSANAWNVCRKMTEFIKGFTQVEMLRKHIEPSLSSNNTNSTLHP